MALASLLARNTLFSFLSFSIRFLLNAIIIIKIARGLDVESFGIFTFAQSFTGIFVILADFGISTFLVKEISSKNKLVLDNFSQILKLKVILSLITFSLVFIISNLFGYNQVEIQTLTLLMIAVISDGFINLYKSLFRGFEKFEYELIITSYNTIILFIAVLIAIYISNNVVFVAVIYVLARVISLIITLLIVRRQSGLYNKKKIKVFFLKKIIIQAAPYGIQIFFGMIYFQIDTILLQSLKGNFAVGIYQVAMKIILMGLAIGDIIQISFLPTLSRLMVESKDVMIETVKRMNRYLLTSGMILTIVIFSFSERLILFVGGVDYLESSIVLKILSFLLFLRLYSTTFGVVLTAGGKQNLRMLTTIIATVLNVSLNIIVINKYSYIGASIVSIVTNFLVLAMFYKFSFKILGEFILEKKIFNILILSGIIGLFCFIFNSYNFIFLSLNIMLIFLVGSYILILDKQEKAFLLKIYKSLF